MLLPRPAFLDRYLASYTWITVGVILHPRGAYLDPAIVAHERVHLREQWGLGVLLALAQSSEDSQRIADAMEDAARCSGK